MTTISSLPQASINNIQKSAKPVELLVPTPPKVSSPAGSVVSAAFERAGSKSNSQLLSEATQMAAQALRNPPPTPKPSIAQKAAQAYKQASALK